MFEDCKSPEDVFNEASQKQSCETFCIKDTFYPGYYRLLEGEHAGRVVLKILNAKIDDKPIMYFVHTFTWIYVSKIENIKCEGVNAVYSKATRSVDWYSDAGIPMLLGLSITVWLVGILMLAFQCIMMIKELVF